ncbi:unnamed protein product [Thlaspi arvense]|uniref:Uncharacterized protein n=1 Tax=Thlaspi arvense TaxID=13288 RepID=A0AAU9SYV2_THLAR|nr:unnamed protein product [Thlaspi arvense]
MRLGPWAIISQLNWSKDKSTLTAKQKQTINRRRLLLLVSGGIQTQATIRLRSRAAFIFVFHGEGAALAALVSGSRTGFSSLSRRSSCHRIDWRLIVGLREENFTEEAHSSHLLPSKMSNQDPTADRERFD